MNGVKSFTIYEEYYELITLLNEEEQKEFLLAIMKYMFNDEDIKSTLNDKQLKIFKNLKRPLDISKKNSLKSKGNGAPKGNQNALKKQTKNKPKTNQKQTHQDVNVSNYDNNYVVNVNGNVDVNVENKYFESIKVNSIFIEFLELRKKLKAVNSERAINVLVNKLNNYDEETQYKMIENSIANSWKGIFEIRETKTKGKDVVLDTLKRMYNEEK